jgi:hypothetical protein
VDSANRHEGYSRAKGPIFSSYLLVEDQGNKPWTCRVLAIGKFVVTAANKLIATTREDKERRVFECFCGPRGESAESRKVVCWFSVYGLFVRA